MWEGGASGMEKVLSSSLFNLLTFVIILMFGLVVQLSRPQTWSEWADSEADLFLKQPTDPMMHPVYVNIFFNFHFNFK